VTNNLTDSWDYDLEFRWQLSWTSFLDTPALSESTIQFEPYRIALNLQSSHSEYIIGLQKINFGLAKILRPLMWFDTLDPTDPLNLTSGVTGISASYYYDFGWSSRAWLLLPGEPMGWEAFPGKPGTLETGGRVEIPRNRGQIGVSSHFRIADISDFSPDDPDLYEGRIGLDGFWDVGVGLWVESVYKHQELSVDPFLDQIQATLGSDYTIWIGSGLHIMAEHMLIRSWNSPFIEDQTLQLSSGMISYSPSMFDQLSILLFMNWESETPLVYLSWRRSYDSIRFTLAALYTKVSGSSGRESLVTTGSSGKGIQLTVAYNH
ncbi:MAG: hypothetical protein L3J79_02875, partial [Candidatus Marinimicrobia bacterium]|nr:hypothetical protein [Candidatus Neomarinimicrobiota bacterium]